MIKAPQPLIFGQSNVKVSLESGASPTFNHLLLGPLSTFPENFIQNPFMTFKVLSSPSLGGGKYCMVKYAEAALPECVPAFLAVGSR